ncbi:13696_t:CDS:2, partial [Ambispora leptoticha]
MSLLISDILDEIFQHLTALKNPFNYHSSEVYDNLYSCILVNKQWCDIAIPHLWRRPFSSVHSYAQYKILMIYLSLLDKSKQEKIKIELGHKFSYICTPTYNYASFIRHLDYAELISAIRSFYFISTKNNKTFFKEEIIFMLSDLVRELFVKSGSRLISLRVMLRDCSKWFAGFDDPAFRSWISGIHNLYIVGLSEETCHILQILTDDCKFLMNLSISVWNFETDKNSQILEDYVVDFLNSQQNLKILSIYDCDGFTRLIIPSLKSFSCSLERLSLEYVDFSGCTNWDSINTFNKLNTLTISYCYNLPQKMVRTLLDCRFPKLQRVNLQEDSNSYIYPKELLDWAFSINIMHARFKHLKKIENTDLRVW